MLVNVEKLEFVGIHFKSKLLESRILTFKIYFSEEVLWTIASLASLIMQSRLANYLSSSDEREKSKFGFNRIFAEPSVANSINPKQFETFNSIKKIFRNVSLGC